MIYQNQNEEKNQDLERFEQVPNEVHTSIINDQTHGLNKSKITPLGKKPEYVLYDAVGSFYAQVARLALYENDQSFISQYVDLSN